MPLRTRLSNTGLKLKIPVRSSSNGASAASPYGPSPNRHSASPHRRREEVFPLPVGASTCNNKAEKGSQERVTMFDASVDSRPVWAVTSHKPRAALDKTGFREIPITRSSSSSQQHDLTHDSTTVHNNICDNEDDSEDDPQSPALEDCKLSPDDLILQHRSSLQACRQRQFQRAEILRDWMHNLPLPAAQPSSSSNPFFAARKKDFNYQRYKYLSSPVANFHQSPDSPTSSVGTSNEGSILTPTDVSVDNPLQTTRRDSSGVLQSPDVLDPAKEDGFYLLKKDSQRRATLVKIMKDDKHNICSTWQGLLHKDVPDTCISIQHLSQLMDGLKAWLPEQNGNILKSTLDDLRESLDFDSVKMCQLQGALYLFQESVNTVLRKHSIKPHWMFALDNLVRSAVQAAILILSPELGPHLGEPGPGPNHDSDDNDDHDPAAGLDMDLDTGAESTSGVSTVNSGPGAAAGQLSAHRLVSRLTRVRDDNRQLLSDLLTAQQDYHQLLKQSLAEQRLHLQMLSQNLASSHLQTRDNTVSGVTRDQHLVDWLHNLAIDDRSVDMFLNEDLSLNDVLELMSRDDLKRLGLKAGPELRIWRAILRHRGVPTTPT